MLVLMISRQAQTKSRKRVLINTFYAVNLPDISLVQKEQGSGSYDVDRPMIYASEDDRWYPVRNWNFEASHVAPYDQDKGCVLKCTGTIQCVTIQDETPNPEVWGRMLGR